MALTQKAFLGASITSFNVALGWGGQKSTVSVSLIEDPDNGDSFITPVVGEPYLFAYSTFSFYGIISDYRRLNAENGNPTYSVSLEDPRELLTGVQLILNNYNGGTNNVPNLLNIFGYLENSEGFGGSDINSAGIPWQKVRDSIKTLTASGGTSYGGSIKLKNVSYSVNLDNLPSLPSFYRIGADSMSLMDFVSEICNAANHDFFFSLESGNIIKIYTVNKNQAPQFGIITNFVNQTDGAVSKNSGVQFRNETTSKFVVGGRVTAIYGQELLGGEDGDFDTVESDNTIWPYWGLDINGNAIIGEGIGKLHEFTLDSTWVDVAGVGNEYRTDVGELRAAQKDKDSWMSFLAYRNYNFFVIFTLIIKY